MRATLTRLNWEISGFLRMRAAEEAKLEIAETSEEEVAIMQSIERCESNLEARSVTSDALALALSAAPAPGTNVPPSPSTLMSHLYYTLKRNALGSLSIP